MASARVPTLGSVPLELVGDVSAGPLRVRFEVPDESRPGVWVELPRVTDGAVDHPPTAQHRRESFLIDYDQAPMRALCAMPLATPDAIVREANGFITNKSLAIAIVTASVVAERREGDCTEHAMLATAMLRCHGHPARLAVGVLVARVGAQWIAAGHMWTERYDGAWHLC